MVGSGSRISIFQDRITQTICATSTNTQVPMDQTLCIDYWMAVKKFICDFSQFVTESLKLHIADPAAKQPQNWSQLHTCNEEFRIIKVVIRYVRQLT